MRDSKMRRSSIHNSSGRPAVAESLEYRTLLTSVIVNTALDQIDPAGSPTVSLRDAVAVANLSTTPTAITFAPSAFAAPKTILLSGTPLRLTNVLEPITITGPAAGVTVNGNAKSQAFVIAKAVTAKIHGVNVVNCHSSVSGGGAIINSGTLTFEAATIARNTSAFGGGAIQNLQSLTLTNVTVSGNIANGHGGGLENYGAVRSCIATLTDVTFTGNKSNIGGGGGIASDTNAQPGKTTLLLRNVTIAGNTSAVAGGGILLDASNSGTSFFGVTIANNTGANGGGLLDNAGVNALIGNTIIAGNTGGTTPDVHGAVKSSGHNLIGKTNGSTGWIATDLLGTIAAPLNAKLGPLANNGGPTQTLLPLAASPAIDHGSNALIPTGITTDQRGLPRIINGVVDIGAVEVQPSIVVAGPPNQTTTLGSSASVSLGSFSQFGGTSPFKIDINWGDGTADTIITRPAAGPIPATSHTFAKAGPLSVSEAITDAHGVKSNVVTFTETVTAPLGSISGKVFDDANGDGKIDNGEFGAGLWTVYLDLNKDGKLDAGDRSVTTDIAGNWSFNGLAAQTYVVRVVPVAGIVATKPIGGVLSITLAAGQVSSGNLFGERATG
ncbi:MAG TPA: choice-of-anchor Q domain-containing protein [Humisphaera sp.]|jgi:hypothetical protein|nr:choice-of-anchor Q domain-containing protein [Humisphaera sp.]